MDYLILRGLCAFLSGMIISQTGSFIQLSSRNVLASPSTLGLDGLSILWILIYHSLLIFTQHESSVAMLFTIGLPIFILVGLIYARSMGKKKNMGRIILMGITFNLLVGAVFSLWQFLFLAFNLPFPVELWFGHFRFSNLESLLVLSGFEFLFFVGWIFLKKELYLFSLGGTLSRNFHLNEKVLYPFLFITVAIGTFCVVALFGAFSFLGLIFPIVARKLWFKKMDLRGEIIFGSILNGLFLMFIDSICYFFPIYGAEVPVGLIATGVGALSLIFLLWKSDSHWEILAKK